MTTVVEFFVWLPSLLFDFMSQAFSRVVGLLVTAAEQWWTWAALAVVAGAAWAALRNARRAGDD